MPTYGTAWANCLNLALIFLLPVGAWASHAPPSPVDVAIDNGHSHQAPGAISAMGTPEFAFNRRLARSIAHQLEKMNIAYVLIGEDGAGMPLASRPKAAAEAGARLLVSIHHDSIQPRFLPRAREFRGFSLFVSQDNRQYQASSACASILGQQMRQTGQAPSRYHAMPIPEENRPFIDEANGVHHYRGLAVLRHATIPAVLIEAGVIVNPEEEAWLRQDQTVTAQGRAIAMGIQQCLLRIAQP